MNYTTNYHLPQWVETDRILMEDFNQMCEDMEAGLSSNAQAAAAAQAAAETAQSAAETAESKADAAQTTASAAYCPDNMPYVIGTYNGGASSVDITLGFQPSLLIIYEVGPGDSTEDTLGSTSLFTGNGGASRLLINETGFEARRTSTDDHPRVNRSLQKYIYIAFR